MGKVITPLWWAWFELHCISSPTRIAEQAHVWPHTIHYEHTHAQRMQHSEEWLEEIWMTFNIAVNGHIVLGSY